MDYMKLVLAVLIFINFIAFFMMGYDKNRAKKNMWRISEARLILTAILGGSVGMFLGMRVFHHKTNKKKFFVGIPIIFVLEVVFFLIIQKICNIL